MSLQANDTTYSRLIHGKMIKPTNHLTITMISSSKLYDLFTTCLEKMIKATHHMTIKTIYTNK